ncbi:MAG: hypothetical protein ABSB35_34235 [Bryobacteraceae bacterium]
MPPSYTAFNYVSLLIAVASIESHCRPQTGLKVFPITTTPLRDHLRGDTLMRHFTKKYYAKMDRNNRIRPLDIFSRSRRITHLNVE